MKENDDDNRIFPYIKQIHYTSYLIHFYESWRNEMNKPSVQIKLPFKLDNYSDIKWFLDRIKQLFPEQTNAQQSVFSSKTSNYTAEIQAEYGFPKEYKGTVDLLNAIYKKEEVNLSRLCFYNIEDQTILSLFNPTHLMLMAETIEILEGYEKKIKGILVQYGQDENSQQLRLGPMVLMTKTRDAIFNSNLLDEHLVFVLKERIQEIDKAVANKMPLAALFLIGSSLEGVLSALAQRFPREFCSSLSAPKKEGKVLPLTSWTLDRLIEVASDLNILEKDVKDFSKVVRGYRNYIHPNEQVKNKFSPKMETVELSLKVFDMALNQVNKFIEQKNT